MIFMPLGALTKKSRRDIISAGRFFEFGNGGKHTMEKIFEFGMLILFGVSWPVSIYKSYRARVVGSKSVIFLFAVMLGYMSGIINKFINGPDYVTFFYFLNMIMVGIDAILYFRNKKLEKRDKKYPT